MFRSSEFRRPRCGQLYVQSVRNRYRTVLRTARTRPPHRIINSLLMRAAEDAVIRRSFCDAMLFEEVRDLGGDGRIIPNFTAVDEPAMQNGFLLRIRAPDHPSVSLIHNHVSQFLVVFECHKLIIHVHVWQYYQNQPRSCNQ